MSPRTRIVGFSVTMFFIVLYAYLLGMFDGLYQEVVSHPQAASIAMLLLSGIFAHVTLEFLGRGEVLEKNFVYNAHKVIFVLLVAVGAYLVTGSV